MLVWLIFAAMTAIVIAALLRPLSRQNDALHAASDPGTAIYRDQLAEIDADFARGLVSETEAQNARIEISRRLIAAAANSERDLKADGNNALPKGALIALVVLITGTSIATYLARGTPWLEGQPYAGRVELKSAKDAGIGDLIAMVEKRLTEHPEDGRGWEVIAPIYTRQGRHAEAARAYANAIRILGEEPARLAAFAQATILAGDGVVNESALVAYQKVLAKFPNAPEPRFWIAVSKEQDGRFEEAAKDMNALLAEAPADASWRPLVEARIRALDAKLGRPTQSVTTDQAQPGPSPEDIAVAAKLEPGERQAMIKQMIARLSSRLEEDGNDLEGWKRLLRSYMVLGQRDNALLALGRARKALAADAARLAEIDAWAKQLGLQS